MTLREQIQADIEHEVATLLAGAPDSLDDQARQEIQEEFVAYTRHVLDALSTEELRSESAFEAFVATTLAHARMRVHERTENRRH
jgi:hypothetical protein